MLQCLWSLVAIATSDSSVIFGAAQVPHPLMIALLNASQLLICESQGREFLSSCFWAQPDGDPKDGIFIDQQIPNDDG